MPQRKHKPEEIVAKLRQVDVLLSQGRPVAEIELRENRRSLKEQIARLDLRAPSSPTTGGAGSLAG